MEPAKFWLEVYTAFIRANRLGSDGVWDVTALHNRAARLADLALHHYENR